jgi:hypothetical protein
MSLKSKIFHMERTTVAIKPYTISIKLSTPRLTLEPMVGESPDQTPPKFHEPLRLMISPLTTARKPSC